MARKSIKGYAEKNYYDNTKFNGGIIATNDPLNEGYFKHLVNFDISDVGQSLTPRKGFLTTTTKVKTYKKYSSSINAFNPIKVDNLYDYHYKICIYTNNTGHTKKIYDGEWYISNGWKYYIIVDSEGRICYACYQPAAYSNGGRGVCLKNTYYSTNPNPAFYGNNSLVIPEDGFLLVINHGDRYNPNHIVFLDNLNEFVECISNGSITNIQHNDEARIILNEQLKLSDGIRVTYEDSRVYVTTDYEANTEVLLFNDTTIYYFDANINKWIFIDFKNPRDDKITAYKVSFDIENNYVTTSIRIKNVDITDIKNSTSVKILDIVPVDSNEAQQVIDEYAVVSYIIKVKYNDNYMWLKLVYRENESEYEGVKYPADTLVVSCLDFEDVINTVDTNYRNIASSRSIIPNPMQTIYKSGEEPLGFVEEFPIMYIKNSDNKYLILTTQEIDNLTITPNFYIKEAPEGYTWAYAYDITSTDKSNSFLTEPVIHKSAIYNLLNNDILIDNKEVPHNQVYTLYENNKTNTFNKWEIDANPIDPVSPLPGITSENYKNYLSDLNFLEGQDAINITQTYIVYIVPKCDTVFNSDSHRILKEDIIDINGNIIKEFTGLFSYFSEQKISEDIIFNEPYSEMINKHNNIVSNRGLFNSNFGTIFDTPINIYTRMNLKKLKHKLQPYADYICFYIKPVINKDSIEDTYTFTLSDYNSNLDLNTTEYLSYSDYIQTSLNTHILFEHVSEKLYTYDEFITYFNKLDNVDVIFKQMTFVRPVEVPVISISETLTEDQKNYLKLFPRCHNQSYTSEEYVRYYFYTDLEVNDGSILYPNLITEYLLVGRFPQLFKLNGDGEQIDTNNLYTLFPYIDPCVGIKKVEYCVYYLTDDDISTSLFVINQDNVLQATLDSSNVLYNHLKLLQYFNQGITINFYLMCIPTKETVDNDPVLSLAISYTREFFINTTPYKITRQLSLSSFEPTTYIEKLIEEPNLIKNANKYLVFKSMLGDHLVVYTNNKVFISVENRPYYFVYDNSLSYPESVVKVIQYKDMLLVFTTQNLYAIYLYEQTMQVENGIDEEGNTKYVQQTTYMFATLPVLYNIMVDERYKDAIQVYNQMVLFYSADGQMFLIKPTAAIDSNTRFSIQYFNKSANDILLNYKDYMQQRLESYGLDKTIDDVEIKVSVNINYIKIFYTAPDIMTYILVYDVINNRYYSYDTLTFSCINSLQNISIGEMYITERDHKLYFTVPNINLDNVDIAWYNNFEQAPIYTEIDTGTINLNNHLKKRFKDLHVVYKNLDANQIKFSLSTFVDDVPIMSYINTSFEIKNVSSYNTLVTVDSFNVVDLLEDSTALFNFTDYSSNKIITHKSNIISKGKTIRIKMNFSSKGKYKIQGYGLIYKEHTV